MRKSEWRHRIQIESTHRERIDAGVVVFLEGLTECEGQIVASVDDEIRERQPPFGGRPIKMDGMVGWLDWGVIATIRPRNDASNVFQSLPERPSEN